MEALIMAVGAKTCCIFASGCGGLTNWAVKKKISWRDLALACLVGWISAEFFIPPVMNYFVLDMVWGPAIAFLVGYCGIRLLPLAEERLGNLIKKS
tara:strand:+ start:1535 stop:1822 length:288 start_codon:yes stop_codon:yes gene_type:complete